MFQQLKKNPRRRLSPIIAYYEKPKKKRGLSLFFVLQLPSWPLPEPYIDYWRGPPTLLPTLNRSPGRPLGHGPHGGAHPALHSGGVVEVVQRVHLRHPPHDRRAGSRPKGWLRGQGRANYWNSQKEFENGRLALPLTERGYTSHTECFLTSADSKNTTFKTKNRAGKKIMTIFLILDTGYKSR